MRHTRALIGGALLVAVAATAWARQSGTAADAGVHTVTVGLMPASVAIDAGTGQAFVVNRATDSTGVSTGQGSVSMLDATGRSVLRTVLVGPDPRGVVVDSSPVRGSPGGYILVANDDDASLSILDARTGAPRRTVRVGANPHAVAIDARTDRAFVLNTGDGTVSVLDARRWTVVRTVQVGADFIHASIAVDARTGRVFVGTGNIVTVLDASSGAILGTASMNGLINGLAVDASPQSGAPDGHLFVAGNQGVSVLNARDGRVLHTLLTDTAVGAIAVDARRHRLVVAPATPLNATRTPDGAGIVQVLDERTGAVLRTVPVGIAPIAVAVDARSGQVVVVNAGGTVPVTDPWRWLPAWLRAHLPGIAPGPRTRTVPGSVSVFDIAPHHS